MSAPLTTKNVTVPGIRSQKGREKIAVLTAYDFPTTKMLDEAGVEIILVGDSLATVLYGEPDTLSVTLEDMLRHTRAVTRAAQRALVVGDMPFLSYQVSQEQAIMNAGRFLKEARAQSVKLEGGLEMAETVRALTRAGIPVMAHIGLTPQSIHVLGNYRMHGKTDEEKKYLTDSAQALSEAGAFSVVLECVDPELAKKITDQIPIPTIGIGSGAHCDGQVLVTHDLVGLTSGRVPKFVEPLANLNVPMKEAVLSYIQRTKNGPAPLSPSREHSPHALSH